MKFGEQRLLGTGVWISNPTKGIVLSFDFLSFQTDSKKEKLEYKYSVHTPQIGWFLPVGRSTYIFIYFYLVTRIIWAMRGPHEWVLQRGIWHPLQQSASASLSSAMLLLPGQQQSPLLPDEDLRSRITEKASELKIISILVSSQHALS